MVSFVSCNFDPQRFAIVMFVAVFEISLEKLGVQTPKEVSSQPSLWNKLLVLAKLSAQANKNHQQYQ